MTEDFRIKLIKSLKENGIINTWSEEISEEVTAEVDPNDIGITYDGTQYIKSAVSKYLLDNGYPISQENIEMAAKMFPLKGNTITKTEVKTVERSEFSDISDEDVIPYLLLKLLEQQKNMNSEKVIEKVTYEYTADVISGGVGQMISKSLIGAGGVNENKIASTLQKRSREGWRLKDSMVLVEEAISPQVILIFERAKVL